jgi:predicted enzyme related to lactoylglutathione lyase
VIKAGGTSIGGVMGIPPHAQGMPPTWGLYVTVDDVEKTITQCAALGGRLLMPPMDIPGVGRMAVIQDPQGATLNVITYLAG